MYYNSKKNILYAIGFILLMSSVALLSIPIINGSNNATDKATINLKTDSLPNQGNSDYISNPELKTSNIETVTANGSALNPLPGDSFTLILNATPNYFIYTITFVQYVDSLNVNATVVAQSVDTSGNVTLLVSGWFLLNIDTLYISQVSVITSWLDTYFIFWIHTGLTVGSHLPIESDTNATVVAETTYSINGKTFNVQNVTFLDGTEPAYGLYDINTGAMLYYYQFSSGAYGYLNQSTLVDLYPSTGNNPPTVSSYGDVNYYVGTTGHSISWLANDTDPNAYAIYQNGSKVSTGSWTSGVDIKLNVDGLAIGTYNYTISVSDSAGQTAESTIWVTVSKMPNSPPTIDHPNDITYTFNSTGNSITWNVTDPNPDSYNIYNNDTLILSSSWSAGGPILIYIDGLDLGHYNFTIVANDTYGLQVSDTVWVTVTALQNNPPVIDSPSDVTIQEGTFGNSIGWVAKDDNPDSYSVYSNGALLASGSWSSGTTIIVKLDGFSAGSYNLTIVVSDTNGLQASDTVWVTVKPSNTQTSTSTTIISTGTTKTQDTSTSFGTSSSSSSSQSQTSNNSTITTSPGYELLMVLMSIFGLMMFKKRR